MMYSNIGVSFRETVPLMKYVTLRDKTFLTSYFAVRLLLRISNLRENVPFREILQRERVVA